MRIDDGVIPKTSQVSPISTNAIFSRVPKFDTASVYKKLPFFPVAPTPKRFKNQVSPNSSAITNNKANTEGKMLGVLAEANDAFDAAGGEEIVVSMLGVGA